jgi:hypothetical protein
MSIGRGLARITISPPLAEFESSARSFDRARERNCSRALCNMPAETDGKITAMMHMGPARSKEESMVLRRTGPIGSKRSEQCQGAALFGWLSDNMAHTSPNAT